MSSMNYNIGVATAKASAEALELVARYVNIGKPRVIVFDGPIANGKTTTINQLKQIYINNPNVTIFEEEALKSKYLALNYSNPKKYCYKFHKDLIKHMARQQEKAIELYEAGKIVIMDRCLPSIKPFIRYYRSIGNLTLREFTDLSTKIDLTFMDLLEDYPRLQDKSDFVYHVFNIPPQEALVNMLTRGRECERNLDINYFQRMSMIFEAERLNNCVFASE